MSGTIFPAALESAEELESTKWNPLQCSICAEQYQEPCLLRCYHSFCGRCVENRVEDGKLSCPVCSTITVIKEGFTLPPPDMLLTFLVESSSGDKLLCANCDRSESQMYFCNTCSQPLCGSCREETHRAKMFQSHEIVPQTKHTRDIQKQCKIHGEPYILFSTEKKLMLCINCFRDMKVESRSHCVDLETAYKQGCQKLDDMMQSIRDLQSSVRDGILLLKALLEDIALNAEKEKKDINELFDTMQEKILETKESLLKEIDRQYIDKEELFKNQLASLVTFLPTLHFHLVTCGAFSSSADKFEFLDFTHALTKRLTAIIQIQHPLHPTETSDIITDYKTMFAKCLEPVLFPHKNGTNNATQVTMTTSVANMRYEPSPAIDSTALSKPEMSAASKQMVGNRYSHPKTKQFKMKLMETKGFFSDHCKDFDESHKELMQRVDGLKLSVQELQRDITLRRSLTKDGFISDIKKQIVTVEEQLDQHSGCVESKQTGLEQHWEECLERIAGEQEIYQAQLQDVGRLKNEVVSVNTILQKLSSFVSSIANVTQRLAPKLGQATTKLEHDSQHAALLQEITTMQPDSQQRVDAIRSAQEERDIKSANRVNPLDEELIKTKGLLRTPSTRNKDSTNRASMEIQEAIAAEAEREREKKRAERKSQSNVESKDIAETEKEEGKKSNHKKLDVELPNEISEDGTQDKTKSPAFGLQLHDIESRSSSPENKSLSLQSDESQIDLDESSQSEKSGENACGIEGDDDNAIPTITFDVCLPDLTMGLNGYGSEASEDDKIDIKTSRPDLSAASIGEDLDINVNTVESDLDSSMESAVSSDESVKQGHVRDIIAKVDLWTKSGSGPDSPDKSQTAEAKEKDVKTSKNSIETITNGAINGVINVQEDKVNDINGTDGNSVEVATGLEKPVASSSELPSEQQNGYHGNNNQGNKVNGKPVATSSGEPSQEPSQEQNGYHGNNNQGNHFNGKNDDPSDNVATSKGTAEEEVYVAKSLPELAQVFEPGELKTKKRRAKSDRNRDK